MTSWAEGYQILEAVILHLLLQHNVRDLHRDLPTCGDSTPVPGFNQDGPLDCGRIVLAAFGHAISRQECRSLNRRIEDGLPKGLRYHPSVALQFP